MKTQDSDITLRFATPADASALLAIYSHYVKNTAVTFEWDVPSVEEFTHRIEETLEMYPYLVAEKAGAIVGYAYAHRYRPRAAYAWDVETSIYVDKDCRGTGVGRALQDKLEEFVKKQGVLNVYAVIVYNRDEDEYLTHASVLFHEKMGFKNVSELHQCGHKFGRWYGTVTMEKMLGEHTANPAPVRPWKECC